MSPVRTSSLLLALNSVIDQKVDSGHFLIATRSASFGVSIAQLHGAPHSQGESRMLNTTPVVS